MNRHRKAKFLTRLLCRVTGHETRLALREDGVERICLRPGCPGDQS